MFNATTILIWVVVAVWYFLSTDRWSVFGSPRAVIAVYYSFFSIAALWFDDSFPVYAEGLLWVAAATLLFWIGSSIPVVKSQPLPADRARSSLWLGTAICTAVGAFSIIDLNESSFGAVVSGQDLAGIADAISAQLADHYTQYEFGRYVRSFGTALLPFFFASAMLSGLLFGLYPKRRLLALGLGLVVPAVATFLSGSRSLLVLDFAFFLGSALATGLFRTHLDTARPFRIALSVVALVVIVTVTYYWRWGNIGELGEGSIWDRLETGWNGLEVGGFGPLPQFSEWLSAYWTSDTDLSWGARLFRGPAGLIGEAMGVSVQRIFEPWFVGPRQESANIFTINRVLIEDFGMASLLFYFVLGYFGERLRQATFAGSLVAALLLGAVYSTIFYFIIDSPFVHTVTLSALALALLVVVLSERLDRIWEREHDQGRTDALAPAELHTHVGLAE